VTVLRLVLGHQLSLDLTPLADIDPGLDTVLMMEVLEGNTYVQQHQQKIVLVLSAMRHFAEALRDRDVRIDYVKTRRT
jgi:deoxyribodipyrimidine photolyase-related protein